MIRNLTFNIRTTLTLDIYKQLINISSYHGKSVFIASNRLLSTSVNIDNDKMTAAECLLSAASVNYFFTRKCNYSCKFCFHTAKTSDVLPLPDMIKMLRMLKDAGALKINFAGGEVFLPSYQEILGELVKASKQMGFESVSIITNGSESKCFPSWFSKYGQYLDILGISVDSVNPKTNFIHGRHHSGASEAAVVSTIDKYLSKIRKAREVCKEHNVIFKINSVVTSVNADENMYEFINDIKPSHWKIFQVLPLKGENCGSTKHPKKDVEPFVVSDEKFQQFVTRNKNALFDPTILKVESNRCYERFIHFN